MIGLMEERPPFVRFERRSEEDRDATIADGIARYRDVEYVILSQHGSQNTVEKEAAQFFIDKERDVQKGRIPRPWVDGWRRMYDEWRRGLEPTVDGTSVRLWTALSPAEADTLVANRIMTVEDLAALNEEGLRRLGIGWRRRKELAIAFLKSADQNKAAEALAAAQARIGDLEARVEDLLNEVRAARAERAEQPRPKKSRPSEEAAA